MSSYSVETVGNDGELILSRLTPVGESSPVLVLVSAIDEPSAASIARLEHAYALRNDLDPGLGRAAR